MSCEKESCDAEAKLDLGDFPIQEVKLLLDMILGNVPFDLRAAVKAVAAIMDYAASLDLFGATSADASCPKDVELAVLLKAAMASQGGGDVSAQFLDIPKKYLLELLIRKVLEWLAERVNQPA